MKDQSKTKQVLIQELVSLRQKNTRIEQSESECKRVEKVLRESEEKYRLIFEHSPLGLLSFDKKGVIVACNDNFVQIIGSSREKLIGLNMLNLPDKDMVFAVRQALNGGQGSYEGIYSSITAKKNTPVRCLFTPMNIGRDGITGGVGIIEDITERKRLELELAQANENNFLNIIDSAADGILIADIESRKFYRGNPAICRMLGYSPEEIKNLGVMDIHPEKDIPYIMDQFEKLAKGEMTVSRDLPVKRKDGSVIYGDVNSTTITLSGKTYILGFFHDNTERKNAEIEREAALDLLRKSEKYFKEITENSSDIVIITDKNGDIKYCSRSIERFTGYKPEELIGRSGFSIIHPDDVERALFDYSKAIQATDSAIPNSFRIVCKDGSERCFEGLGKNLLNNPDVAGFVMNVRDITERRQAEAQRESAIKALKESEMKYRHLYEKSRDAIMIIEPPSWQFTAGNPAAIEMFKAKDEEEFVSCEPWTLSPERQPDGRASEEKAREMIEKAMRDGFNLFEWTHKRLNGEEFLATVLLSRVEKGDNVFLQATVRDITKRRREKNAIKESEERFRSIVSRNEDAIIVTNAKGKIEFMNPAAGRVFNREVESLIGTDFGLPLVNGEITEIDIFRPDKDPGVGDMYVVETEWLGEKAHLITIRDITGRKQAEEKIKKTQNELFIINNKLEERNRQNVLLSEMRELLQLCSNIQEVPAIVSSYAVKLFPGTHGALFQLNDSKTDLQSVASWGNFPEDVDNNIFAPDACWGLRQGRVYVVEDMKTNPICPHLKKPLSTAYICLPLIAKGELFGLLHLGTLRSEQENGRGANFSELKEIAVIFAEYLSLSIANIKLSEKLTSQSIRDPLTRLYNRRYMDEIIQHEILRAARQQTGIGIVMVDIDHFKQINDTYGHETGDEYLMELADFFRLKIRGSDFIFRYGGEEFILILPESSVEDTYKYAESLREEIKNMKVHFRGQRLPSITLSFGVAAYPDHGLDTIELIQTADKALYRAKEEGRDRVIIG
jgi:diguanylate cyclase (GGDEF)-like protein/PAS domain S-box-containing protein